MTNKEIAVDRKNGYAGVYVYASILLLLMTASLAFSQENRVKRGNEKYDEMAYIDAIEIYKKVGEKGYKSNELFERLGNSYYFNGQFPDANKWYAELFKMNSEKSDNLISPEYYYRYSQTLKSVANENKANEYLNLFAQKSEHEIRAKLYLNDKNYLDRIKLNSGRYTLQSSVLNTSYSEFGAAFFKTNFVFASSRPTFQGTDRINKWDNQPYTNLLVCKVRKDGVLEEPQLFSKNLKSKFNESTPVFTKDGKTIYFTRNNDLNGKVRKNKEGVILLKIYKATFRDGDWENITELPFNSNDYSVAHPALSPDEKILYFASNMSGTIGQSDLFRVTINQDGTYGKPENLGISVNTEGRETFPFVSQDNDLYFASNGQLGLGGLDIFVAKINPDGTISKAVNLGAPVNSSFDDFCYYIDTKTKNGFFSSNRNAGLGFDDIYRFIEDKPLKGNLHKEVDFFLIDKATNYPIADAEITLYDEKMNLLVKTTSTTLGICKLKKLEDSRLYHVKVDKAGYETIENTLFTDPGIEKKPIQVTMEQKLRKLEEGVDLAKLFHFHDVYFDLDKYVIKKESIVELAKVAELMKLRPTLTIEVRSHTDSRESMAYNLKLSNLRAKATIDWLVKRGGVDPAKISGKGYGEAMLLNKCADGVPCTKEEHALNRRSEFIITGLNKQ